MAVMRRLAFSNTSPSFLPSPTSHRALLAGLARLTPLLYSRLTRKQCQQQGSGETRRHPPSPATRPAEIKRVQACRARLRRSAGRLEGREVVGARLLPSAGGRRLRRHGRCPAHPCFSCRRGKAQNSNGSSPKRPAGAYLLFLRDFRRGFLQVIGRCIARKG